MATWTVMAPGRTVTEKGGGKPLLFLRPEVRISAEPFYASLFLSSPPRKMHKKAQQILTSVAIAVAFRRPPWCITVWSWSFVLILCYFEYLDVRPRVIRARARAFLCVFVQYNTN